MGGHCTVLENCSKYDTWQKSNIKLESAALLERGRCVGGNDYSFSVDYELNKGQAFLYRSSRMTVSRVTHRKRGDCRGLKEPREPVCFKWWQRDLLAMESCDHPNICRIYEHFAGGTPCQVVELCLGKSLSAFCRSATAKMRDEAFSGLLMRQVLSAIGHLHSRGYCHLELRSEDFIFSQVFNGMPELHEVCLKLISLGAAEKIAEELPTLGEKAKAQDFSHHSQGRAPEQETAHGCSDRSDVWAVGVIAFSALTGAFPTVDRSGPQTNWKNISWRAKDFIKACLKLEPAERPEANCLLEGSSWATFALRKYGISLEKAESGANLTCILTGGNITPQMIVEGFQKMAAMSNIQRVAITAAVLRLPPERTEQLRRAFQKLDKNGNGSLSVAELVHGLGMAVSGFGSAADMTQVLEQIDTDGSRSIDYTEFIAATYSCKREIRDEVCQATFALFDQDRSGKVTLQEIKNTLGLREEAMEELDAAIADTDGDGEIDFEEFKQLLKGSPERLSSKEPKAQDLVRNRSRSRSPTGSPRADKKVHVEIDVSDPESDPPPVKPKNSKIQRAGTAFPGMQANKKPVRQGTAHPGSMAKESRLKGALNFVAQSGTTARRTVSSTTARMRKVFSSSADSDNEGSSEPKKNNNNAMIMDNTLTYDEE